MTDYLKEGGSKPNSEEFKDLMSEPSQRKIRENQFLKEVLPHALKSEYIKEATYRIQNMTNATKK